MSANDQRIAALLLESIALMSKRFVQKDWSGLVPELAHHLQNQQVPIGMKRSLEAIKKICKKYRFMFRSDDLYREMNYMIENLSPILLQSLIVSVPLILTSQISAPNFPFSRCFSLQWQLCSRARMPAGLKPQHRSAQWLAWSIACCTSMSQS